MVNSFWINTLSSFWEERKNLYAFLWDSKIETEISLALYYATHLLILEEKISDKEFRQINKRTMAMYLFSVIEVILVNLIKKLYREWKENHKKFQKMFMSEKYIDEKELHVFVNDNKESDKLIACRKKIRYDDIVPEKISLRNIILGLRDTKLFDDDLLSRLDALRQYRNHIHIETCLTSDENTLDTKIEQIANDLKSIAVIKNQVQF